MIEKGNDEERAARAHIRRTEGMLKVWNEDADRLRLLARSGRPVGAALVAEAEALHADLEASLDRTDLAMLDIAPGHELMGDLLRLSAALEALKGSVSLSAERLDMAHARGRDIAGLEILVRAVRATSEALGR